MTIADPSSYSTREDHYIFMHAPGKTRVGQENITVWVVDDHPDFRETVQDLIDSTPGMQCPLAFDSSEELLDNLHAHPLPDIILMDVSFPGNMSGIDGVRRIRSSVSGIRILMLTMNLEDDVIFEALRAGAHGYVFKMSLPEKIIAGIRETVEGGMAMSPTIVHRILDALTQKKASEHNMGLTKREREIMNLLIEGRTTDQIATHLNVTKPNINTHIRHVYEMLHRI